MSTQHSENHGPTRLSLAALPDLTGVDVPAYDRGAVTAGIVHVGVGGFHRAHQAMVIDDLLAAGGHTDWGICGVGVLPGDERMRDALQSQDHLYTLVEKHPDGHMDARVIGSLVDYLFAPDDPERVIETMAAETTRIVSLTVTEGGYNINQVTGQFQLDDPGVARDQASETPHTVFGLVVEALRRRRDRGMEPFTIMSCDNVQNNGAVARHAFTAFARARDAELAAWIEQTVLFPNSMVDRITPVTTDEDRAEIARRFGIVDAWPVVCEPFFQWVLEDRFTLSRPDYGSAGVQVVDDVEPYEYVKLRLLNSSHQALCYFGHLMGYRYAHDAAQDPLLARFLLAYMDDEATETLKPVSGIDVEAYKPQLVERFSNPGIRDTIARLCAESSDRIPKWLVPVIRDQLATDEPHVRYAAAIVASWARYAEGVDEQGDPIEVVDRLKDRVMAAAQRYPEDRHAFLRDRELFGDLVDQPAFVAEYDRTLESLHEVGARRTLEALLPGV